MRSIEATGKTVEDAVRAGLKQLGCDSSDVNIDVISMGSPGLFGMFGKLAKVRLTVKEEDPELDFEMPTISLSAQKSRPARAEAPKAEAPKAEAPKAEAPKTEASKAETPNAEAPKAEAPASEPEAPVKAESKPAPEPRKPRQPKAPKADTPAAKAEKTAEKPAQKAEPFEPSDPEKLSREGRIAYDFLSNVTEKMGVHVEIRVTEEEDHLSVAMMGDTLGILIGRRGDTLDALQYLTSLQVNKGRDNYMRVSLDTENYRAKREEALTKLAMRMANRAHKTGRKVTLEPMNPYERRVLHSALQNNPYVTTHSEGEEPYRRVVITLKESGASDEN